MDFAVCYQNLILFCGEKYWLSKKQMETLNKVYKKYLKRKEKLDENHNELKKNINKVINSITKIEKTLYQTKNRSGQDPLNFPIKLNNKLAHLASVASSGNYKPTDQMYGVRDELIKKIDIELNLWNDIKRNKLEKINTAIKESNIQLISIN